MISYRFVPISSQKGVLFLETPGISIQGSTVSMYADEPGFLDPCSGHKVPPPVKSPILQI